MINFVFAQLLSFRVVHTADCDSGYIFEHPNLIFRELTKVKINKQKHTVASVVAISLASFTAIQADDNPFNLKPISKSTSDMTKLAMGMCGGNMEGMCGGMMEGMCGGNMPHGISPTILPEPESVGAKAVTEYCVQCHALPAPGMHTAEEWPAIVGRMNMRMQMMEGMMGIDAPDQKDLTAVIDYLQTNSQQPIDKTAYPDLISARGKIFSQTCSQCHVLPEPKQHTADVWPTVVGRMLGHIAVRNKSMPNNENTKQIIEYLQRHSDKSK